MFSEFLTTENLLFIATGFYDLQRELLNEIIKNWDEYCKKVASDA